MPGLGSADESGVRRVESALTIGTLAGPGQDLTRSGCQLGAQPVDTSDRFVSVAVPLWDVSGVVGLEREARTAGQCRDRPHHHHCPRVWTQPASRSSSMTMGTPPTCAVNEPRPPAT